MSSPRDREAIPFPRNCPDCPIRHRAVCSYSSPAELAELDAAKSYRDFASGQEIVAEGMPATIVGSLVHGTVALEETLADGRRQMVGLLFPSDFIGRPLRQVAQYGAKAVSDVRLCLFDRGRFERLMMQNRTLERRLLEMTLDELDAARHWHMVLGRKTAREKIASFLLMLSYRLGRSEPPAPGAEIPLDIPLSREAIADFLGLTIETVSRQFTQLRKRGVISLADARTATIIDLAELSREAGYEDPDGYPMEFLRA